MVAKLAALPQRDTRLPSQEIHRSKIALTEPAGADLVADAVIPSAFIARPRMLADSQGFALAVIPGDREIDLAALREEFGRSFRVASQSQIPRLLPSQGDSHVPLIGAAPHCETFLEQSLVELPEVYFEAADGRHLVRLEGESFRALFYGAWCGRISRTDD